LLSQRVLYSNELGAVESIPGRQFLPSVAWRTGQSGADFFPSLAKPTVGVLEPLAHRTLCGAHRTVRCPLLTVGSATRRARITRSTVGQADCWFTGQFGAPPDSSVIYSRTPPTKPESSQFARASLAHRTLSGAPRLHRVLAAQPSLFQIGLFLFLALTQYISLQNNVLSLRNIPLLLICTLSIIWHRLIHDHLCWHSITKILRNGPRAHFPFNLPLFGDLCQHNKKQLKEV
jgi:hypothetical protein